MHKGGLGRPTSLRCRMNREELEAQAKELDLKVDGRWSDERLSEEINALLETEVGTEVEFARVRNMHNGPWVVDGAMLERGEEMEIDCTTIQAKNSIEKGFLKVC